MYVVVAMKLLITTGLEEALCILALMQMNCGWILLERGNRHSWVWVVRLRTTLFLYYTSSTPNISKDEHWFYLDINVTSIGIQLLTFCIIWEKINIILELCNAAVHEGDGEHLLRCWSYLLSYSKVPREETIFMKYLKYA